jgi:hypothetical protein
MHIVQDVGTLLPVDLVLPFRKESKTRLAKLLHFEAFVDDCEQIKNGHVGNLITIEHIV